MSNVRAPQFVVDLVSDLRDRRLLLPAGLLLLAMIAVPLLLSSSTEPPPPPAVPAAEALAAGEETQPAVLTENITVRDYRKRLDELKSTNPFEARLQAAGGRRGSGGTRRPAAAGRHRLGRRYLDRDRHGRDHQRLEHRPDRHLLDFDLHLDLVGLVRRWRRRWRRWRR